MVATREDGKPADSALHEKIALAAAQLREAEKDFEALCSHLLTAYLDNHFEKALPLMRHYLGEPYGYFTTETGDLNQFVHLWRYDSMADREQKRAAMYRDPRWTSYRANTGETGLVTHQHNRILRAIDVPPTPQT